MVALGSSLTRPLTVPQVGWSLAGFWPLYTNLGIKNTQPAHLDIMSALTALVRDFPAART